MRKLGHALVGAALLVAVGLPADAGQPRICEAPESDTFVAYGMPRLAARLAAKQPATILVLGTASSLDYGTDPQGRAYPARLLVELRKLRPVAALEVVNLSVRGETAAALLKRLPAAVAGAKPDLVVWQTGSTDAVARVGIGDFAATLEQGVAAVFERDVDLLLMTPNFVPHAAAMTDFEPYVELMEQLAQGLRVPLLNRFDLMRYWQESGAIPMDVAGKPAKLKLIDTVQSCIAHQLARTIATAVAAEAPEGRERPVAKK